MAAPIVTARGLDNYGIELVASADGRFQSLVDTLIPPGSAAPGTDLMIPYAVVLVNNTDRGIIAYSTQYTFTDSSGSVTTQMGPTYWNLNSYTGGDDVPARSAKLVSSIARLGQTYGGPSASDLEKQMNGVLPILQKMSKMDITLDMAVFADGQVIGPDANNTAARVQAYLDSERDLNNEVISRSKSSNPDDVLAWLKSLLANKSNAFAGAQLSSDANAVYQWHYQFFRLRAAQSLISAGSLQRWGPDNAIRVATNRIQRKQYLTLHR